MWEMISSWQTVELVLEANDSSAAVTDGALDGISFMQMAALAVSSVSVVTKEALYHYTLRVGHGSNSDSVRIPPLVSCAVLPIPSISARSFYPFPSFVSCGPGKEHRDIVPRHP